MKIGCFWSKNLCLSVHSASSSPVVSLQPTSAQSCSWAREGFTSLSSHKLLIRTIIYRAWQGCVSHFILKQVSLFWWYKGRKWFSERLRGLFRQGQGVIPSQTHQTHSWQKRTSLVWWEHTHKELAGPYTALWEAIAACYWLHVSKARMKERSVLRNREVLGWRHSCYNPWSLVLMLSV